MTKAANETEFQFFWHLTLSQATSHATYRLVYPVMGTDPAEGLSYTITRSYRDDHLANAVGFGAKP